MSFTIPTVNIKKNQTFSSKVDIRCFDGKLYICKIEDDGNVFQGAELVLDDLPAASIYGTNGSIEAFVLESEVQLNIPHDSFTDTDRQAFEAAVLNGISVNDAIVKIKEILPVGSGQTEYAINKINKQNGTTTVEVTTSGNHTLSVGDIVTVSGVTGTDELLYNGTHTVTSINSAGGYNNIFNYNVESEPSENATNAGIVYTIQS
tara:strand:- start:6555 stop:7169 length:615 start_codon:yes stop_codon:yes gene_type:complete